MLNFASTIFYLIIFDYITTSNTVNQNVFTIDYEKFLIDRIVGLITLYYIIYLKIFINHVTVRLHFIVCHITI